MSIAAISINEMIRLLGGFYDQYGYLIVFLSTFAENTALLGLLLPGNSLALLGAFYARLGTLNLAWVIVFATLGTMLGYHIDYLLGRFGLEGLLAKWSDGRWGRRLRLAARVRLARRLLSRHGGKAIVVSHVIGHMRSFVAISAGLTRMPYRRFLLYETLAALFWNTTYSLVGYFIAVNIDALETFFMRMGWIVIAILALAFMLWQTRKGYLRRQRQARRTARYQARKQLAG